MTYHDEIVDEVRAIREQLCNQAAALTVSLPSCVQKRRSMQDVWQRMV